MELKNWPIWVKGGILGVALPILFAVIAYVIFMLFGVSIQNLPPFSQINNFFASQCGFLTRCQGQGCLACILWIPILVLSEFFILGFLVSSIYRKQRN